jgi:integrase
MLTVFVGLLASTGLRSGEARRLDRADVDLVEGVLHIRKTKFRKDRLVPIHTTTLAALRLYARHRDTVFPAPRDPAFFLTSRGNRLSSSGLFSAFGAACRLADLDGVRPHDLRHRFAVNRLAAWHRDRADVQAGTVNLSAGACGGGWPRVWDGDDDAFCSFLRRLPVPC